jgi:ribosomal protein S27E
MAKIKRAVGKLMPTERIPGVIKRCPKCHRLTLVYDPEQKRIYCTSCGFTVTLKT